MRSTLIASVALLASTAEAKIAFGKCPDVKFMPNIDEERWAGRWYTILRDDAKNPQYMTRCDAWENKLRPDGGMDFHVHSHSGKEAQDKKGFDALLHKCGEQPDSSTCMVTNPMWKNKEYPFTLFATDYDNYAIYYFCFPFAYKTMNFQFMAVASRTKELPQNKLQEIKDAINAQLPEYDIDTYTGYSPNVQEDWCEERWKWDAYLPTDALY